MFQKFVTSGPSKHAKATRLCIYQDHFSDKSYLPSANFLEKPYDFSLVSCLLFSGLGLADESSHLDSST